MKTQSDLKDRFVIIMAGGRGERFWPVSREKMPKQLLPLLGKRSFLQQAVDRVLPLVPAKKHFRHHQRVAIAGGPQTAPENPQSQPHRVVVGCRRGRQHGGESNCQPRQVL